MYALEEEEELLVPGVELQSYWRTADQRCLLESIRRRQPAPCLTFWQCVCNERAKRERQREKQYDPQTSALQASRAQRAANALHKRERASERARDERADRARARSYTVHAHVRTFVTIILIRRHNRRNNLRTTQPITIIISTQERTTKATTAHHVAESNPRTRRVADTQSCSAYGYAVQYIMHRAPSASRRGIHGSPSCHRFEYLSSQELRA